MNAIELGGISRYEGFPCSKDKCANGGVCIPAVNNFKCKQPHIYLSRIIEILYGFEHFYNVDIYLNTGKCLNGFRGRHCQKSILLKSTSNTFAPV
jgi:hypothetical protein